MSSFFKKSYNSRTFACESYLQYNTILAVMSLRYLFKSENFISKLLPKERGVSPDLDQAEIRSGEPSLLCWVSFQKQCLIIYFYLDSSGQH